MPLHTPLLNFEQKEQRAVAYIDGGSHGNPGEAGFGIHILGPDGQSIKRICGYLGVKTNNYAEYSALLEALRFAIKNKITCLEVYSDSELLVKQIQGVYQVRHPALKRLHSRALRLIKELTTFSIKHIPREQNKEADRLVATAIKHKKSAFMS